MEVEKSAPQAPQAPQEPALKFSALLERIRQGSEEAVRELLDDYGPHILRVVRRRLNKRIRSRFDSQDFVQDVWASFFADRSRLKRLDGPEALVLHLVTMARNKVIDEFRQHFQTSKRNVNRERALDGSAAPSADHIYGREATPSQEAISNELWARLLSVLPGHYQQIVSMRHEGMTQQEIADRLGIDERTVRRVIQQVLAEEST